MPLEQYTHIFQCILQIVTGVYIYLVGVCRLYLTKSYLTCNIYIVGWVYYILYVADYVVLP